MANKKVTVQFSAEFKQLTSAINTLTTQIRTFSQTASQAAAQASKGFGSTGASAQAMARGMGMATSQAGRFNASMTVGRKLLSAMRQETTLTGKAFAAMKEYGASIATISAGFLAVNATIRGVRESVSFAIDAFATLDEAATQSTAILTGNSDEIKSSLKDLSQSISSGLRVQAADVAQGFYFLASAGLDAATAMRVLPQATAYAQAGLIDMEKATEQLMDVTTTFGNTLLENGQAMRDAYGDLIPENVEAGMTKVSDVLARASIDSNATIDQLASAVQGRAGSMATQFSQSLEDVVAAVEAFSSVGIKGSQAGTYYSMVLRDLSNKGLQNAEAFRSLNVEVYNQEGRMRPLQDIVSDLDKSFGGLNDKQRRAALLELGLTDRSVQATLALLSQSESLQLFRANLDGAAGSVENISQRQLGSFSAKLDLIRNKLQNVAADGIESIIGGVSKVNEELGPLGQSLGEFFDPFIEGMKQGASLMGTIFGTSVMGVLKGVSTVLSPLIGGAAQFTGVIKALGAIAIVQLVRSMTLAAASSKVMGSAMDSAKIRFMYMKDTVTSGIQRMREEWLKMQVTMQTSGIGNGLVATSRALFSRIGDGLTSVYARTQAAVSSWSNFKDSAVGAMRATGAAISKLGPVIQMGLTVAITAWQSKLQESQKKAQELVDSLTEGFDEDTYSGLVDSVNALVPAANSAAEEADKMGEAFSAKRFGAFVDTIESFWGKGDDGTVVSEKYAKVSEEIQKLIDKKAGVEVLTKTLKDESGFAGSADIVMRAAMKMGIPLDQIKDKSYLTAQQWDQLKNQSVLLAARLKMSTDANINALELTGEEIDSVMQHAEDLEKNMEKLFVGLADPVNAYRSVMLEAVKANDVFDESLQKMIDKRNDAIDAQVEMSNSAMESQIKALEAQKDAALASIGVGSRDEIQAYKDASTEQLNALDDVSSEEQRAAKIASREFTDSTKDNSSAVRSAIEADYDARIEALRSGQEKYKSEQEKTKGNPVTMMADQFMEDMTVATSKWDMYKASLNGLFKLEGVNDPVTIYQFFAKMKPEEGQAMLDEILTKSSDFVNKFSDNIKKLNDTEKPTWEATKAAIDQKLDNIRKLSGNIVSLGQAFGGQYTQQIQEMAVQLGDAAPDAFQSLRDQLGTDPTGVQQILEQWKLANSTSVESVVSQLIATGQLLKLNASSSKAEIDAALEQFDVDKWTAILKAEGFDEATVGVIRSTLTGFLNVASEEGKAKIRELVGAMAAEGNKVLGQFDKETNIKLGSAWAQKYKPGPWNNDQLEEWGKKVNSGEWKLANGGILHYANGGEYHTAQIAKAGENRMWAEQETGGEAYIPLGRAKRANSMAILGDVANMFGYRLNPQGSQVSASAPIVVPMSKSSDTTFTGDIYAADMKDIERKARLAKRRSNVVNG